MDECVPGNVLRLDNARKSWTFYLSISELGGAIQQCEGAWMPIAILRECEVKKISNGFSQCVRALLRRLLLGSSNMREHGVVLPVDRGRPAVVFITAGALIFDYAALCSFWSCKSASGLRPCFLCSNVTSKLAVHDESGRTVDINCVDVSRFVLASSEDRFVQADTLHNLPDVITKGNFEELEKVYGIVYNPGGVLWDKELRSLLPPLETTRLDPTQCFCFFFLQWHMWKGDEHVAV
jgi:hypothetical protein